MWREKFEDNLMHLYAFASHWVATVWIGVFSFLQYKGEDWTREILGGILPADLISPTLFLLAFFSYIAAIGWPQPKLARKLEDQRVAQDNEADAPRQ